MKLDLKRLLDELPFFDPARTKDECREEVVEKKRVLLEMARTGKKRPISGKDRLGAELTSYVHPNRSHTYDGVFAKQVRQLRPDWFPSELVKIKKAKLLEMAKTGKPKPSKSGKLGQTLYSYTKPTECYDKAFTEEIRKLRPDWFVNSYDKNKVELLKIARMGESRPKQKQKLGGAVSRYTNKKSGSYDSIFDKKIRKLRPDWFVSISDIIEDKKAELLKMARLGKPKPAGKRNKLENALYRYTSKKNSTYDSDFDKKIRKLRPDWISRNVIGNINRLKLLEMAKNGEARPKRGTELGEELAHLFFSKGKSGFSEAINKLRPDWFPSRTAVANKKKIELLKTAKAGKPRPSSKRTSIGRVLISYTFNRIDNKGYDADFDRAIRKLRPDWFVNTADEKKAKLLEMANRGGDKPVRNEKLSCALYNYIRSSSLCYDSDFSGQIRQAAPQWFGKA